MSASVHQRLDVLVSKSGAIMQSTHDESDPVHLMGPNQMLVEVTKEIRWTFHQGFHISLPILLARRQFVRTITDTEFLLLNLETSEVVLSSSRTLVALKVEGKFVSSYSISVIQLTMKTRQSEKKAK